MSIGEPWRLSIDSARVYIAPDQRLLGGSVGGVPRSWADIVWIDVSDDVRVPLKMFRGKHDERTDIQASTATVTLDCNAGTYDPDNVDGPYYGQLLPYTPIKIVWSAECPWTGNVEQGTFFGTTGDDWPVPRHTEDDCWTELRCVDLLVNLSRCKLSAYLPEQSTWDRINAVLDLAGWPALSVTAPYHRVLYGDPGGSTCAPTHLDQSSALEAIMLALRTEGIYRTVCGIQNDGDFAFGGRYLPWTAPFSEIQATFGNTPGAISCGDVESGNRGKNLYTQVRVSFLQQSPTTVVVKSAGDVLADDGFLVLAALDGGSLYLTGDIPEGALLDFGTGLVARVLVTARAGDGAIYIDPVGQDIPEGATAVYQSNVCLAASNAAQLRYGKTELPFTGLLLEGREDAQAMADDALLEYGAPRSRIDVIPLSGITDEDQAEQIVQLGVGELVRFEHRPRYSGTAWGIDLRIHGYELMLAAGDCTLLLHVAPAPVDRDFWFLGVDDDDPESSLLGVTDDSEDGEAILSF